MQIVQQRPSLGDRAGQTRQQIRNEGGTRPRYAHSGQGQKLKSRKLEVPSKDECEAVASLLMILFLNNLFEDRFHIHF
jgi:hypothetical protein